MAEQPPVCRSPTDGQLFCNPIATLVQSNEVRVADLPGTGLVSWLNALKTYLAAWGHLLNLPWHIEVYEVAIRIAEVYRTRAPRLGGRLLDPNRYQWLKSYIFVVHVCNLKF
jgi:hypothetical protein